MLTEETNKEPQTTPTNPDAEIANEESTPEKRGKGTWREAFLSAFQTARRHRPKKTPASLLAVMPKPNQRDTEKRKDKKAAARISQSALVNIHLPPTLLDL